jgi:3-oxoacyl-[acyl-carrier protein] reductase
MQTGGGNLAMMDLSQKRALVCGSTQGIGYACAAAMAGHGASVTLVARNEASLNSAVDTLSRDGDQAHDGLCADFTNPDQLSEVVRSHIARVGGYHILLNNTGGPKSGPILDATADQFVAGFTQHVVCNQLLMQAVLPGMKEAGYGRIVNIISTSVFTPIKGLGVSNTIRAAVANWAKTVANEVGPFGITVNNVLPGYTDTVRLKSLIAARAERTGVSEEQVVTDWISTIPMGRLGRPEEIGEVVAFLASPAASYVSGVNLPVDGARLAAS